MKKESTLYALLALYCATSFIHFAHNAQFLKDYPNMPAWLTPLQVYAVWLGEAMVGLVGVALARTRLRLLGVFLIGVYATLGFDGLGHYWLAPMSAHTVAMNLTIWAEVLAAAALLWAVVITLARHVRTASAPA